MAGATTKLNMPYPTGGDPVAGGDDAIKALADRIEATQWIVSKGILTVPITASTPTVMTAFVAFPVGLYSGTVPVVMVTARNPTPHTLSIGTDTPDSTGFNIYVTRLSGAGANAFLSWVAFGQD